MPPINSRFTDINSLRTHFLRDGEGAPLILLHGWPEWSHVWRPVMLRLVGRFDLIAPKALHERLARNCARGNAYTNLLHQLAKSCLASVLLICRIADYA